MHFFLFTPKNRVKPVGPLARPALSIPRSNVRCMRERERELVRARDMYIFGDNT